MGLLISQNILSMIEPEVAYNSMGMMVKETKVLTNVAFHTQKDLLGIETYEPCGLKLCTTRDKKMKM